MATRDHYVPDRFSGVGFQIDPRPALELGIPVARGALERGIHNRQSVHAGDRKPVPPVLVGGHMAEMHIPAAGRNIESIPPAVPGSDVLDHDGM